jgi:hypothetical protein
MPWTKEDLIKEAYSELGMADFYYDLDPEQIQSAARKMEAMIAEWGLRIGYNGSADPNNIDINADSGLPDSANAAVYMNLAVRLARSVGKQIARELKVDAKQAYEDLVVQKIDIPQKQFTSDTFCGAGNQHILQDTIYMPIDCDQIVAGNDGDLILE